MASHRGALRFLGSLETGILWIGRRTLMFLITGVSENFRERPARAPTATRNSPLATRNFPLATKNFPLATKDFSISKEKLRPFWALISMLYNTYRAEKSKRGTRNLAVRGRSATFAHETCYWYILSISLWHIEKFVPLSKTKWYGTSGEKVSKHNGNPTIQWTKLVEPT